MKKQMKQVALPLFLGGLIACSPKTAVNETDLLGNWTEILPPSSNFVQGMTLAKEGKASSISMATLQYESWQLLPDGQLILNGKSIGNGQTISFSIKGNSYRLIVVIKFTIKFVYIRFIGTHAEYDKIADCSVL